MSTTRLRLSEPLDQPERLRCPCGCDHFKINLEGDMRENRSVNSVECEACHEIYIVEADCVAAAPPSPSRAGVEPDVAEFDSPYKTELLRIAEECGDISDPFSAWETIALWKRAYEKQATLAQISRPQSDAPAGDAP